MTATTKLTYHEVDGILYPDLIAEKIQPEGRYARARLSYLENYQEIIFLNLLTSGELNNHLREIQQQAEEMSDHLMQQMAKAEGINETLKMTNQMAWVRQMNNLRSRVNEIIYHDLIYAEELV